MTQYNSWNVKLSNSQLNKLKSVIKNKTEIVLRLSSNVVDIINWIKTRLSEIIQSGGFLGGLVGPLLKTGLP